MSQIKLGFIGAGNMAKATIEGILANNLAKKENITIYDINIHTVNLLVETLGISKAENPSDLAKTSDVLILAVKPNVCASALKSLGASLSSKAIISIAAGKSVQELSSLVPSDCRILRVMPNTPAMVGEGMTALCTNTTFTDEERKMAEQIFGAFGRYEWVSEGLIDAVTAVSGSGPAYVFMVIEAMADGGVREGLSRELALKLAAQTVLGAAKMVLDSGKHPAVLRDMVCSPGGTTIDAVYALEDGGLRASLIKAVEVCAEKSRKLSKP